MEVGTWPPHKCMLCMYLSLKILIILLQSSYHFYTNFITAIHTSTYIYTSPYSHPHNMTTFISIDAVISYFHHFSIFNLIKTQNRAKLFLLKNFLSILENIYYNHKHLMVKRDINMNNAMSG